MQYVHTNTPYIMNPRLVSKYPPSCRDTEAAVAWMACFRAVTKALICMRDSPPTQPPAPGLVDRGWTLWHELLHNLKVCPKDDRRIILEYLCLLEDGQLVREGFDFKKWKPMVEQAIRSLCPGSWDSSSSLPFPRSDLYVSPSPPEVVPYWSDTRQTRMHVLEQL
jgi:hypothetical protein